MMQVANQYELTSLLHVCPKFSDVLILCMQALQQIHHCLSSYSQQTVHPMHSDFDRSTSTCPHVTCAAAQFGGGLAAHGSDIKHRAATTSLTGLGLNDIKHRDRVCDC